MKRCFSRRCRDSAQRASAARAHDMSRAPCASVCAPRVMRVPDAMMRVFFFFFFMPLIIMPCRALCHIAYDATYVLMRYILLQDATPFSCCRRRFTIRFVAMRRHATCCYCFSPPFFTPDTPFAAIFCRHATPPLPCSLFDAIAGFSTRAAIYLCATPLFRCHDAACRLPLPLPITTCAA